MSKRKIYRPKPVNPIGGLGAIDRRNRLDMMRMTLDDEQIADLGIAYRLAYQLMTDGHASGDSWGTVCGSLNIALALSDAGYGSEYRETFNRALAASWRAKLRADRGIGWGYDGDGQQAIKFALSAHDSQIEEAPKYALIAAIAEVKARIERGDVYAEAA